MWTFFFERAMHTCPGAENRLRMHCHFQEFKVKRLWTIVSVGSQKKKSQSITEMTAQKPRVYVMESQSFNLTPPPCLFLTVRR